MRWNSASPIKSLVLLKVVAEVIDPVIGSFQLGRIERQVRTIEATNIRVMNLFLVIYASIGRLQTRDIGRQTINGIVGWNYGLGIIFPTIASTSTRVSIDSTGRMSTSTFFK